MKANLMIATEARIVICIFFIMGCQISEGTTPSDLKQRSPHISQAIQDHANSSTPQLVQKKLGSPFQGIKHVEMIKLEEEKFVSRIEVSGKALAARESYLSLAVSGLIQQILVKRGDYVRKGQVLLRLDRSNFQLGVERAKAALEVASTQADQLVTEIERLKQLLTAGAAATASIDEVSAKEKAARAQVRMARAGLEQARKAYRDAELRAPYAGVITEIFKERGEQAPAMPPTMLMKIVDTAKLEVQVFLPEEDARLVKVRAPVEITVDSAGSTSKGEVIFVSNTIQPGARTFEVRVGMDNPDRTIKAGSFARVRIRWAEPHALFIPNSSVIFDERNHPHVFILDNGQAKKRRIEIGRTYGSRVLVQRGLHIGQKVFTGGVDMLSDGQTIAAQR